MKLQVGKKVKFKSDKLPYTVMASSERFAVCSRKLNRRADARLLHYQVEMHAYSSFTQAYEDNKDNPVYTIIDFDKNIRGKDNLVFGYYDYFDTNSCNEALNFLEEGGMEVSRRSKIELDLITY